MKGFIMAHIDYKEANYSIASLSTQQFTFWWGRDGKDPKQFFDVFIAPIFDKKHGEMVPIVEIQRQVTWSTEAGVGNVLYITLRNDNRFAVEFIANHVRIYN
jgi:hypothetical protein